MRIALLLVAATALRAPARHSATRASVATTRRGGAAAVANATTTTLRGGATDDKIAAAIDACRAALAKRANNTKAAAALATLLRQTGDEDGALAALAQAAAHGDGGAAAFRGFVGYELRAKRFAAGGRRAARGEPNCAAALELRATERRAAGDAAEAARLYAEAADVAKRTGGDAAGAALRAPPPGAGEPAPPRREGQARAQLAKWTDGDEDWRRAPLDASYVSGLFDQFANTFEQKRSAT
ncbi:methyltransferase domain-containing protein [Aureococcus anophagefferens]|nr:methyltransferase domain-containing protein [Aureococcus anophagefferens]